MGTLRVTSVVNHREDRQLPLYTDDIKNIGFSAVYIFLGDRGATVVKVLCYKSEGRWFDPR